MLYMFIRVYIVTYVEPQLNLSKFRNFISSWRMFKTIIKLKGSFSIKSKKTCKENQSSIVLNIRDYDVTHVGFKIL